MAKKRGLKSPSVTIIVGKEKEGTPGYYVNLMATPKPWIAMLASDPKVRADGETKEDAIKRLYDWIVSYIPPGLEDVEITELNFDEMACEELINK